ncbi:hypothetical protein SLS53_005334 [Cytospora paraplurivora]|uniref:non-specific serine/threonine protein kinase n=1 Tax=Cytospora paraplurivora TaxID=2898453 RepID=A0AAN9U5R8_9PEZI
MIKLVKAAVENDDTDGFKYDVPPEIRVSTTPQAVVPLPQADHFPKVLMWQRWTESQWALYMPFYNGGTLRDVIEDYSARGDAIPEHLIWHVAEQVGEALVYMHLGRPYGTAGALGPSTSSALPGWRPVYHRDIDDSNVFLHYPRTGHSQLLRAKYGAFPQVVLGDYGEAAIQGDDQAQIQLGVFPASTISPELKEWTDVYQFGCVLRRLCMAHIPEGTDEDSDDDESGNEDKEEEEPGDEEEEEEEEKAEVTKEEEGAEEGEESEEDDEFEAGDEVEEQGENTDSDGANDFDTWALHRPESHTLKFCNQFFGGQIYSDALIGLLERFERPNMGTRAVTNEPELVPSIAWVAETLLPEARRQLQQLRNPKASSVAHYTNLDVSWTKPETIKPFAVDQESDESMRGLKRIRDDAFGDGDFGRPRPKIQRLEMGPPVAKGDGEDIPEDLWENL